MEPTLDFDSKSIQRDLFRMNTIASISEQLKLFRDERDWQKFHTVKDLAAAISIEASELQELTLWKSVDEINISLNDEEFRTNIEEECADVLNYLILISHEVGFDLLDVAVEKIKKMAKNTQ